MINFAQNNPCIEYTDKVQVAVVYAHNYAYKNLEVEHCKQ